MELVLETLIEKKIYLEHKNKYHFDFYGDNIDAIEKAEKDIKAFEQTIDLIEYFINIKKNN
jgi:hypothetical protein